MRFFAIDWSDTECRYLLASVQKGRLVVQKADSADIAAIDSGGELSDSTKSSDLAALGSTLRNVFKEERIGSCPSLICLDRSKVELLYQTLPPCKETEIPVLLKNQVLRELSTFSEHDPLDFLILGDGSRENRRILAAAIPLSYRQLLVRSFRAIGCVPQRIGFKALAAAELLFHSEAALEEFVPGLVVNVAGNDVDLVLVEGKQVLSIRSLRLPEQLRFVEIVSRITEEVQRAVTVGDDSMTGQPIKKVFLFGNEDDWTPLVETLTEQELEVIVINPFTVSGVHAASIPEQPGRFAPLLGILFAQQSASKSDLDFLHPKEAPKPKNYIRSLLLAIILLGICGYGVFYWNQGVVRSMEEELVRVKEEHQKVAAQLQQVQPGFFVLNSAKNWDAQNVVWLDEFRELSTVLPGDQDLVVSQMSFTILENNPRYSGMIQMSGMARDPSILLKLQTDLRSRGVYLMQYPVPSVNPAGGGYPWLFRTTIYRLRR